MHRGVSESSLRGFSIDYDNLDDLDDDSPPLRPADWKPRPSFTRYPPRRLRTYAIVTFFILVVLYLTFRRGRLHPPPGLNPYLRYEAVDWSRFAYSQYVTTSAYLCNAVMVFEALHRLGSRAERILFYPEDWDTWIENGNDRDSQLLVLARDQYNVQLMPIKPESIRGMYDSRDPTSWDWSITKFYAFSQTQYDRVLHIDSDVTILQNMDELFFLPPARVAMPRAYWDDPRSGKLTSLLVLIEPSYTEYQALMEASQPVVHGQITTNSTPGHEMYDMELLNERYGGSALVLPHRQYGLLTGEFRTKDHRNFLGNDYEQWDPDRVLREAKLVHFSDWPLPKPWVMWPQALLAEMLPKCDVKPGTDEEAGCRDREVWRELYEDFRRRRKEICKLLSYPAPDWPPRKPT